MKYRYSYLILPLQLALDLLAIVLVVFFINDKAFLNSLFLGVIVPFWLITSFFTGFYKVYRFTKFLRVLNLIVRQFFVFTLGFFAFFGIFKEGLIVNNQFTVLISIFTATSILKFISFFVLRFYRNLGKNYRKVVVLGVDDTTRKIVSLFNRKTALGYKYYGSFTDKKIQKKLGNIKESFDYILENSVDEIYCSLKELDQNTIKKVTIFCNKNNIGLKLIPESDKLFSKNRNVEYYDDTLKILHVRRLPFEFYENYLIKRFFDILFSFFVCLFIMTWVTPILWLLIKIESKGPAIFKQKREGLNGRQFVCYKFRSMKLNSLSDKVHATQNDMRVTKIGSFIRKTSIDELPQFFNVLQGSMSVVGPRPHLPSLSLEYQKDVEDYLKRHVVKPGITGLAQVSGYRGEIKRKSDIKNRIRLDIFYIENWSFLLDIKIIIMTVFNVFKGEEKAY
ncbi:exopolysaccharide biosynthesis polyprenyl glycosylphosphotransferase [Pseudotenacibaculum sp. MALMAid0570]|uniref:exopolysaccharide biosynthesis polyprenyl glycosylphosphotransferase n=1 Tax=Pseudotenacibaculum sp. MALMAid0570 TaxID=3143938 RepID=UPI0032DE79DC